jgi:hypothetical protein
MVRGAACRELKYHKTAKFAPCIGDANEHLRCEAHRRQARESPRQRRGGKADGGKRQKDEIAPCIDDANAKKTKLPLASMMQPPKRRICSLHRRCNRQKDEFAPCIGDATAKKTKLLLASAMQTPKRQNYSLHRRCKHQKDKKAPCTGRCGHENDLPAG